MEDYVFKPELINFLKELENNNNRPWFHENKWRYEAEILKPALAFIREFEPLLKGISESFVASDKRVGGSLMRVYRDTRFSGNKTPYKTNVGIQFRHEYGKDVHAPGFYVHISPEECLLGVGLWRPDSKVLGKIRDEIVDNPEKWKRARDDKKFRSAFDLTGESLKTAPRGYPRDHPLIEDLRRKDHIAVRNVSESDVMKDTFIDEVAEAFSASRPYMRYLCEALSLPF
ncbi:MAG: DUF2461 domain-containing protein [Clostridia bacterium]|nr:DUF2461 domain-containing protein [Clostridia bacterium]